MKVLKIVFSSASLLSFGSSSAYADVYDYKPSSLIGGATAGVAATAGAGVAGAGVAANAAGFYTLTHAVTGATMLASTAGGASAAGTVGIMGGTAGAVGTIASIIMAPVTIIAGAVIGGGVAIYEGACYFKVERVEDPAAVREILQNVIKHSEKDYYRLNAKSLLVAAEVDDATGKVAKWNNYFVEDLYVQDGNLMN
ncbi:hypothetical protein OAH85_11905, partial [Paracoccaceae bacterium]|nr:hypothetical protein [Paracoccaceae bacterium]